MTGSRETTNFAQHDAHPLEQQLSALNAKDGLVISREIVHRALLRANLVCRPMKIDNLEAKKKNNLCSDIHLLESGE